MILSTTIAIVIIALVLSIDAFVVSLASGIAIKYLKIGHAIRISFLFGLFQAIMPVVGWVGGRTISHHLESLEYFIAAGIFFLIGGKMIVESFLFEEGKERDYTRFKVTLVFAIATSIDAFAVGVSFSLLNISIIKPVLIIGLITFVTSFIGVYIGNISGKVFGDKVGIGGGVILLALGVKFLIEAIK